jgi:hypothetical protein
MTIKQIPVEGTLKRTSRLHEDIKQGDIFHWKLIKISSHSICHHLVQSCFLDLLMKLLIVLFFLNIISLILPN